METIQSLLHKSSAFLSSNNISEPRLSAELLLAHILGCKRLDLYLRFDKPVAEPELERMRDYTRRRLKHEPVQYIIGETEFYGLVLRVNPSVLIPRPDTEHLVERAIQECKARGEKPLRILDVGTGSGCIAIAVCAHAENAAVEAVDVSAEALATAAANAQANGVAERITFTIMDIMGDCTAIGGGFDLIVSNPPYLTDVDFQETEPEVREFEPRNALSDAKDGLSYYRRIAEIAPRLLAPDGAVLVEIGFGQHAAVREIFSTSGFSTIEITKDYAGIDRVLVADNPSNTSFV